MVFAMYCTGTNVDWVVGRSWVGKPKIIPLIVLKQSNVTITIQAQHTPHHENRQKKNVRFPAILFLFYPILFLVFVGWLKIFRQFHYFLKLFFPTQQSSEVAGTLLLCRDHQMP